MKINLSFIMTIFTGFLFRSKAVKDSYKVINIKSIEDFDEVKQSKVPIPFFLLFTKDHDDNSDLLIDEVEIAVKKLHGVIKAYNLNCDQYTG